MTSHASRRTFGGLARALSAALCLVPSLAVPGRATVFEVTNNAGDTSSGSLGAALNSANGEGAATSDTIFFGPFVPAPITVAGAASVMKSGPLGLLSLESFSGTNATFSGGLMLTGGGAFSFTGLTASNVTVGNADGTVLSTYYSSVSGLTLYGGTFQTQTSNFTSGVTLMPGAVNAVDTYGSNPTMTGVSGAGDLTVIDSLNAGGILTLTGANTYSGSTFVNSGTLQLGNSAALPLGSNLSTLAGGTFDLNGFTQTLGTVNNAGTVRTGAGTLTATTFNGANGTLAVMPTRGTTNLNVTGTANISNGTLTVLGHPGVGVYTVITAGTLAGNFTSFVMPQGVDFTDSYAGNMFILDIVSDAPFTYGAQSPNQAAVGTALNNALFGATGDLSSVLNQILALTPAQQNMALDQIGPVAYAALSGLSFAGSGLQSSAVSQRLTGLQSAGTNPDGRRFASFGVPGAYPGPLVAELPGDASAADSDDSGPPSPWGFFVSGLGTFATLDSINGGSGYQPGYSLTANGGTLGADYRFNDHFTAGFTTGYVDSFAKIDDNSGTIYGRSVRLGVYGTAFTDDVHANVYIGGAHDFYDTSRNIPLLQRTATASPSGQEFNFDAAVGSDFKTAHAVVMPFAELSYDRLMLGSFTEGGAGALDLAVSGQTAVSMRSVLGTKVSQTYKPSWCDLTPYASLGWQHEFVDESRLIGAALASGGTALFNVRTADVSREAALYGAGLDMDWTSSFATRLAYAGDLRSDFHSNTFNASLRWRF